MYRGCSIFFLLFIYSLLHGQEPAGKEAYLRYYQAAEKYYKSINANETTDSLALAAYNTCIRLLNGSNIVNPVLINCYARSGTLQLAAGDNAHALANFQAAMAAFAKGAALKDSLLFVPYLFAGSIHYSLYNLDSAVFYYKKAELINNHYTAIPESGRLYNKLGVLYYETGDYRRGIPYFEKALADVMAKKPVNAEFVVNYKSNIASSFLKMGLFSPALDIYKELLTYHKNEENLYTNIGLCYLQQGDPATALQYFKKLQLEGIKKYNNLTRIFIALKQYDSAALYLQQAIKILDKTQKGKHTRDWGLAYKNAGDIAYLTGKSKEALQNYQLALIQLVPGFEEAALPKNPLVFKGIQHFSLLFEVLVAKAKALEEWREKRAAHQNQKDALAAYTAALSLARYIERTYSSDDARLFLKNKVNPACAEAVDLALQLYRDEKQPAYLSAAFELVESNKASVLQAGMQQLELSSIAGLPASLVAAEKNYKSLIARLTIQLSQVQDSSLSAVLQKKLSSAELSLSEVQSKLDENPAYNRLKFYTKQTGLEEIQQQLNKDQAVLSYYFTTDQLVCFYITRQQAGYTAVALNRNLFNNISTLRRELESVGGGNRQLADNASTQLYQQLLQPVMDKIKDRQHLVIIPFNEISYLPFEMLKDEKGSALLLNKFAISYHYSANFLFDTEPAGSSSYEVLAMAPFNEGRGTSLLPVLPSSAAEIAGLAGKTITGEAATRAQFIALSGQYPVIHLATHAVANDKDPLGCYIEFYGNKDDADSVHRLYEKEIYNLNMKSARLVILSACETGNGLLINGEGIESLSRAFSYAGCKSVITSLWKADDAATAFIMKQLHINLQKGMPKDEALQQARLAYLNSNEVAPRYKEPAYWAHLVLIGNAEPVTGKLFPWWILAIPIALGLVIVLLRKRKRAQ